MNCTDIEKNQDRIEQYVTGSLRGADRDRFEEHLLTCEACQEQLEELALLRTSLADERWAVAEESRGRRLEWHWSWAAAAAALLLGLGLMLWLAPWAGSPSNEALVAASMVEAPPFEPKNLRSVTGDAEIRFQEAMQQYLEGSYGRAIPGLEAAVELDPSLDKARFYLGTCYLLEDEPKKAIDNLSRIAELESSPYREWAHFYRAKAHLRLGDLDSALSDLSEVISVGGDLRTQAEEVLEQIPD
jgi:tetratricopeptide (TPR) repeat protein